MNKNDVTYEIRIEMLTRSTEIWNLSTMFNQCSRKIIVSNTIRL